MRKHTLTVLAVLPLLLSFSHAAATGAVDPPSQPWMVYSSEESGSSSYLGVDINDVTTERLSALKLKEEKGVEITMVDQDAPAGKAGLKEHDVILTMNGTTVESKAQLQRMIHETPPGRIITLGLSRDGQPLTIKVQLADKHKQYGMIAPKAKEFHFEMPDIPAMPEFEIPAMVMVTSWTRHGLQVENITPQLGEFFGVKNGNGVLVRSVEKGSRAEKAGFRAGDVIVKINDQPVHDTSDFTHVMRGRAGGSINVGVIRDKREQTLSLPLPESKDSGEILEESFEAPEIDAESTFHLAEVQQQLAKLRPQLELAVESARKSAEAMRKSLCDQQKQIREQSEKEREQLRKEQLKLRNEVERMRRQLRATRVNWLEI